jgi:hypothetical protein
MSNAISNEELMNFENDEAGFESAQVEYLTAGKKLLQGDTVTGEFIGTEESKFGGINYRLRTSSGVKVLNGSGSLKTQIETVAPKVGDILRVTYDGSKKIADGKWKGKDCHQYTVKIKRV